MAALQELERDTHSQCGHQLSVSTDDEMAGGYEIETATCYACAALDEFDREDGETPPGQVRWARQAWDPVRQQAL